MIIAEPVVLLVDDCEDDALLMRVVFKRAGFTQPLQRANDGEEAIAYLAGEDRYADRTRFPWPEVVLLDLNMPRKNGFEVLEWMLQHGTFKRTHVHVLSASSRPEDIARAYELGVNSYLVKPGNLDGLVAMARCLFAWTRISHFPASANTDLRWVVSVRAVGPDLPEEIGTPTAAAVVVRREP